MKPIRLKCRRSGVRLKNRRSPGGRAMPYLFAAVLPAAVFIGCAGAYNEIRRMPIADVDATHLPDGVYRGAFTYGSGGGFTYIVDTTVAGGRIIAVHVVRNRDTPHARKAEGVIPKIVAADSPAVDAVAGATTTSKALMKAVENALTRPRGGSP
jgi:uncharacterized protein with FMN-binding domain